MKLEIACFAKESALIAAEAGADRIELCARQDLGGITPSLHDFISLKAEVSIPIYVMIRARGGDFVYTLEEAAVMKKSLLEFKNAGADGFVFGALTAEGDVDYKLANEIVELAGGLPCTFHRAFDEIQVANPVTKLIDLGFSAILTSGNAPNAQAGAGILKLLQEQYGQQICIMPGGGVRSDNIVELQEIIKPRWIHSSAILDGVFVDADEVTRLKRYSTFS